MGPWLDLIVAFCVCCASMLKQEVCKCVCCVRMAVLVAGSWLRVITRGQVMLTFYTGELTVCVCMLELLGVGDFRVQAKKRAKKEILCLYLLG